MTRDWAMADRVSDRIVAILQAEVDAAQESDLVPTQLLAGQCLALLSFLKTAPQDGRPLPLLALELAARTVLEALNDTKPTRTAAAIAKQKGPQ